MNIQEAVVRTPPGMLCICRKVGDGVVTVLSGPEKVPGDRDGFECQRLIERLKKLGPRVVLVLGDDDLDFCVSGRCIQRYRCPGMPVEIFSPYLLPATA